jgi:hypothetical protein
LDVSVPDAILRSALRAIADFGMFQDRRPVISAFSGGKDSTITAVVLQTLGYDVVPTAVDMGYSADWYARVAAIGESVGAKVSVVPVRAESFQQGLPTDARAQLVRRLHFLDELDLSTSPNATPCTECYNTKVSALQSSAARLGIHWIAFGHHATDAIASFLKGALMYIDRWDRGHERYERSQFSALVDEFRDQVLSVLGESRLLRRAVSLVEEGLAATDEPPVAPLVSAAVSPRIARPLFHVFEHEIIDVQRTNSIRTESSGCAHGQSALTEVPREMVHYRVLRALAESKEGRVLLADLLNVVRTGLHPDGTLVVDVRRNRDRILGPTYRAAQCSEKL